MTADSPKVDPALYQLAIEQTRDYALFLLDTDGRVLTWNAGAEAIKGYAAEEIIGRHFSIFYPPEALQIGWPAHELKVATQEGRFEDEGWRIRKDGSRFWANVVITALRDDNGQLVAFSKITRDLTDRKLHEEALRQSEEQFRLLVDGVVDYAIYMLDPTGVVTSWNAGARHIKGYTRDEIIGRHFSRFYAPEDIAAGKPWEDLAAARRSGRAEQEGWRFKKNGQGFWARTVLTRLSDAEGRLRGFAKVTQDLSERRQIKDLERATQNVTEFIAMLAHELRNPLAPIRYAVQVLAKGADPAPKTLVETIDRQSAQLSRIVDDLLEISRVTQGILSIEEKPVDLADVVRIAVETALPLIEARRHTVSLDLPDHRLLAQGDAQRLMQLVANLLNNAARYTPEGGRIAVTAEAEGGEALVRVSDNGRGIEPQMMDHIFDMFVQGPQSVLQAGGGLGIGLALARKIAQLHGGSLEAHSEGAGKGSEFTLRIPLMDPALAWEGASAAAQAHVEPGLPRRVLVVDDNVDAAEMLDVLLKSLGHKTCVAHDGLEALKRAADFHPDIVLLDIGLPGADGYEVARGLRALRKDDPLRIVAITGWGQDADKQKSRQAGFDVHLVKPVDPAELMRVLDGRPGRTLH
jgi:PAS domain S-box-containing protein